ncbi:hypothetical protein C0J52_22712 [Blattella germanica]|nr:hypothetical protein C0J52_22712 [Blattella germanica]PSN40971.1 hypothetical protein C0J52_22712 [Blattella germanica]
MASKFLVIFMLVFVQAILVNASKWTEFRDKVEDEAIKEAPKVIVGALLGGIGKK